jgi:hypothetical protein
LSLRGARARKALSEPLALAAPALGYVVSRPHTQSHCWPSAISAGSGFVIAIFRDSHCSAEACHGSKLFAGTAFEVATAVGVTRILPKHMKAR